MCTTSHFLQPEPQECPTQRTCKIRKDLRRFQHELDLLLHRCGEDQPENQDEKNIIK